MMKVKTAHIEKAVSLLTKVLGGGKVGPDPWTNRVLVGQGELVAWGEKIELHWRPDFGGGDDPAFGVDVGTLKDAISSLKQDGVREVQIGDGENGILIAGPHLSDLQISARKVDPTIFPKSQMQKEGMTSRAYGRVPQDWFREGLKAAKLLHSSMPGYLQMDQVLFERNGSINVLVSTDTIRLTVHEHQDQSPGEEFSVRLPHEVVLLLDALEEDRVLMSYEVVETPDLKNPDGMILTWQSKAGCWRAYAELSQKDFPNWRQICPTSEGKFQFSGNRESLAKAIKTVEPSAKNMKMKAHLRFNGDVQIEAKDIDAGLRATKTLPTLKYSGEGELAFNARFLREMIEMAGELVKFDAISSVHPSRIRSEDTGYTGLLMPINL